MHRSLFPLASLLTLIVVAPGCVDRAPITEDLDPRVLYDFESCDELLGYAKGNAKDMIEEYGNPWGYEDDGLILEDGGQPVGGTGDPSGGEGGDGGGAGSCRCRGACAVGLCIADHHLHVGCSRGTVKRGVGRVRVRAVGLAAMRA